MMNNYLMYILVMAGVTYLLRMLPMTFIKGKIKSPLFRSFIYYVPYAVLSAMTIPAIFYSAANHISSFIGLVCAVVCALLGHSLLTVALTACTFSLLSELVIMLF